MLRSRLDEGVGFPAPCVADQLPSCEVMHARAQDTRRLRRRIGGIRCGQPCLRKCLVPRERLVGCDVSVRAWSLACVRGGAGAGVSPFLLVVAAFSVFTCLALQDRILNLALSLTRTGTRTGTLPAPRNGASARPPPPITIPWCVVVSAFARCETVVVPANTHHHAHVRVSGRAHRCV